MTVRTASLVMMLCVATSVALAQREPQLRFPPEKFSTHPVQPSMSETPAGLSPAANPERWPVVQTPWVKYCGTDKNDPQPKSICLTVKEVRLKTRDAQPFVAGVAMIEAAGEAKKIFRATLPPDLQRSAPVRARIDEDVPRIGDHRECRPNGCMWDFPADAAFVERLKAGEWLHLEGVAAAGGIASYRLSLGGFARANEGAPTDPATFEKEQKQRWQERSRHPFAEPK